MKSPQLLDAATYQYPRYVTVDPATGVETVWEKIRYEDGSFGWRKRSVTSG